MKKTLTIAALLLLTAGAVSAQTLISGFTFETLPSGLSSTGPTYGPLTADSGNGSATGVHATATTVYSSPSGNGSARSFSSNMWTAGDYYQFSLSTAGNSGIYVAYSQTGSATGPAGFDFQYSTNGGSTFTTFGSYTITAITFSATTPNAAAVKMFDLTSVPALNNNTTVVFRIVDNSATAINGGTVGTGGTDRVDDFNVSIGGFVAVPEPSTIAYAIAGLGTLVLMRFRRRTA